QPRYLAKAGRGSQAPDGTPRPMVEDAAPSLAPVGATQHGRPGQHPAPPRSPAGRRNPARSAAVPAPTHAQGRAARSLAPEAGSRKTDRRGQTPGDRTGRAGGRGLQPAVLVSSRFSRGGSSSSPWTRNQMFSAM